MAVPLSQDQQAQFMAQLTTAQVQLQAAKDCVVNAQSLATYNTAMTAVRTALTAMDTQTTNP
jgi:hypothetical protein